jgi:methionine-S-sulfoxide reductase
MNKNNKKTVAIFAGGCFWCMVSPFHVLDGIESVRSGYIGDSKENATYERVKSQETEHYEGVKIVYDPEVITYEKLLKAFWMQIDPTDDGGQFHDRGKSYRSAIFYTTEEQKELALKSKEALEASNKFTNKIVTKILPATPFYDAEEYHQDFYKKEEKAYKKDRSISGRDEFIKEHWGEEYWAIFKT